MVLCNESDLTLAAITQVKKNRESFRSKIHKRQADQKEKNRKNGTTWSNKRKEAL